MRTYTEKRISDIQAMQLRKKVKRQYIAQIRRRGWADCDCWSLDRHLARYMLPMLRRLFSSQSGYPCELRPGKWRAIKAEITWAVERFAKDDIFEIVEAETGYKPRSPGGDNRRLRAAWARRVMALHRRAERGMILFGKYFGSLWD